jgi:leader peptidase (prepilin peptidase)/N-methyltransferase
LEQLWQLYGGVVFAVGLLVGSFLNVCIARMPEDRSVVSPPSHCPACGKGIRPYDNIPVISWLLLRGRCRDCRTPISSLYPTVELLTGCVSWLLWRRLVDSPADLDGAHVAAWGVHFGFAAMLVALTFVDLRHYIIPDEFSIYAVPFGVGASLLLTWLGYPLAIGWKQSVLGAALGGGLLVGVMLVFYLLTRRDGMGMGDVKLLAMIGAFLGAWPAVPFVIFVSSLIGAGVGVPLALSRGLGVRAQVPFGPFLSLAALIYILHGPELIERWLPGIALLI